MIPHLSLRTLLALSASIALAPSGAAQDWESWTDHPGDPRYVRLDYPVAFVANAGHADPATETAPHFGLDVISASNPSEHGPDGGLFVFMPDGRVAKLFPLPEHEAVAGLIDTPLGELGRGAVVEPNVSEDGQTLYFAYFHDATWEHNDGGYQDVKGSFKGADLYRLDLRPLLADPGFDPALLPVKRLTFKEYTGPAKADVFQTTEDKVRDAVNPDLAANPIGYWGTIDMHLIEMRTRSGLKAVWVSNRARLANSNSWFGDPNHNFNLYIADFLPDIKDTRYINGTPNLEEGLLDSCDNFYLSQAGDGRGFLGLVSFDMSQLGGLNATTIVGKPGAVYASHQALYVAVRHYSSMMSRWYFEDPEVNREATTLHKFALEPGSIQTAYAGSGVARGRILNQFSMDEHEGYLRIATSNGQVPSPGVHSILSVLAEQEGELVVVGMVDNIAPSEDIRSVRFNGEVGFVVTFKKTDPLFVFDLSDPTDPVIKAELKVPGFATYMHLMDDTHLLTMGYDAEEMGTFAYFQGLQLRVLDVSDLTNPTVLSEETIGTRGSTSDAATNHLAFNYFPQRDLLALPMTICEESTGGSSYGDMMSFGGLLVYRVTVAGGFDLLGGVPHEEPETIDAYRSACSNWWTDSNSKVKRSIFMSSDTEDFVYSIALDLINVSDLTDLENPLVSIPLVASP